MKKNIMLTNIPHTTEGAKLQLSAKIANNCKVVYRLNDNKKGARFAELWNPNKDYDANHIILPLQSTYAGISDEFPTDTVFGNVVHSSTDERPGGSSWIDFLDYKLNPHKDEGVINYNCRLCCAKENKIYEANSNDEEIDGFTCTDIESRFYIKGGHVVMNVKNSVEVEEGGDVMLLPICAAHNSFNNTGERYAAGQGFYMKLARPMKAVILKNFLDPEEDVMNEIANIISGE